MGITGFTKWHKVIIFAVLAIVALLIASSALFFSNERPSGKTVKLGVVWPEDIDFFLDGVRMATAEINAAGGVLGKQVEIVYQNDDESVTKARLIAQEFAEAQEVSAVIGHAYSYLTIPTAPQYEFSGLVLVSPASTDPKLTQNGYKRVFRTIPSDVEFAKHLAQYMAEEGHKKIIIFYVKDSYGQSLANNFEKFSERFGLTIVDRLSYEESGGYNYEKIIATWKNYYKADAIFLAGTMPHAAHFVKQARAYGLDIPIVGGDGLDSQKLMEIAGDSAEGVIVASIFHIGDPAEEVLDFTEKFEARYDKKPDAWSAQGYDAVNLVIHAIRTGKSEKPSDIADVLHKTKDWRGVTGIYNFDEFGEIHGKKIVNKVVRNGSFDILLK